MDINVLTISVFLPLIAGFLLLFLPARFKFIYAALTLVISAITFWLALKIFGLEGSRYTWPVAEIWGVRLDMVLYVTALARFILPFAMGFGLLVTLYSLKSMAGASRLNQYYGSVLLTIGGAAGILLSDQLVFLLIFWEVVTVSLYLLITTGGRNSNFAATKSFAMIGASDAAFLLGLTMVWTLADTFVISDISLPTTSWLPVVAFLLLMTAAITKAGAMPLHTWVPTSGEYAPTSVMALLPAALDKLLGIYLLVIVVRELFELSSGILSVVLSIIGAGTIVIAVMIAMVQHDLKKLLSFHAVSQVGYMILGIATMTPIGIAGGVFHMLNNAVYKCCLFLAGGAVEQQTGTADLERLGGLGRKMPITFGACMIAALSISGIPPLNGFASKWMVYQGIIGMTPQQTHSAAALWPLWLVAAMFGSALTLASFVKILHSIFLSRLPDDLKQVKETSFVQTLPMVVLAAACVFFGVFYRVIVGRLICPALDLDADSVMQGSWDSGLATALILVGVFVGLAVWIFGRLKTRVRIVPTWTCGEIQPNDQMIIPGTHFYKTVSSMGGLRQLYTGQEKGYFDLYNQGGRLGLVVTELLRWLHCGVLPVYLTWLTLGLLVVLFAICGIW